MPVALLLHTSLVGEPSCPVHFQIGCAQLLDQLIPADFHDADLPNRLALSPRYLAQARALVAEERFDLFHFPEPLVPFLSPILLRESDCVNVATFHAYAGWSPAYQVIGRAVRGSVARLHGRIAVSAAARHFIDHYFPGDYKVIPNGVDLWR